MKLHELKHAEGAKRNTYRKGRGVGSGNGKNAGSGHKGQNSRSGGGVRPGFEGGQMPLTRRLPRRGFNNKIFKKEYTIVNVGQLNTLKENSVVTAELLLQQRIVNKIAPYGVKVLGNGKLEKVLTVKANAFSDAAVTKITKAGGKVEVL